MIYATLGFVIVIVFWGLVNLIATGIGLEGKDLEKGLVPKGVTI